MIYKGVLCLHSCVSFYIDFCLSSIPLFQSYNSLFRVLLYVRVHYWRPEIAKRRMKFHDGFENIPISLQQSLRYAHEDFFPNIMRIFIILLTLSVTSDCCERSFSSLRRLKTWERATMDEERLCGLAMPHVHRDMNMSRVSILRRIDETGHFSLNDNLYL
jgi:hypothetical protein